MPSSSSSLSQTLLPPYYTHPHYNSIRTNTIRTRLQPQICPPAVPPYQILLQNAELKWMSVSQENSARARGRLRGTIVGQILCKSLWQQRNHRQHTTLSETLSRTKWSWLPVLLPVLLEEEGVKLEDQIWNTRSNVRLFDSEVTLSFNSSDGYQQHLPSRSGNLPWLMIWLLAWTCPPSNWKTSSRKSSSCWIRLSVHLARACPQDTTSLSHLLAERHIPTTMIRWPGRDFTLNSICRQSGPRATKQFTDEFLLLNGTHDLRIWENGSVKARLRRNKHHHKRRSPFLVPAGSQARLVSMRRITISPAHRLPSVSMPLQRFRLFSSIRE